MARVTTISPNRLSYTLSLLELLLIHKSVPSFIKDTLIVLFGVTAKDVAFLLQLTARLEQSQSDTGIKELLIAYSHGFLWCSASFNNDMFVGISTKGRRHDDSKNWGVTKLYRKTFYVFGKLCPIPWYNCTKYAKENQEYPCEKTWNMAGLTCSVYYGVEMGHRCGYVDLGKSHPWHGKHYDEIPVEVHGGLTFARKQGRKWRIGFDCAHAGDLRSPEASERFKKLYGFEAPSLIFPGQTGHYWTLEDTVAETNRLALQCLEVIGHC